MKYSNTIYTVKNFKQFFKKTTFSLKQISIVVGPNGSGKSSFLDAVRIYDLVISAKFFKENNSQLKLDALLFDHLKSLGSTLKEIKLSCQTIVNGNDDDDVIFDSIIEVTLTKAGKGIKIKNISILLDSIKIHIDFLKINSYDLEKLHNIDAEINSKSLISRYLSDRPPIKLFSVRISSINEEMHPLTKIFAEYMFSYFITLGVNSKQTQDFEMHKNSDKIKEQMLAYILYDNNENEQIKYLMKQDTSVTFSEATEYFRDILNSLREFQFCRPIFDNMEEVRSLPTQHIQYKSGKFINDYYNIAKMIKDNEQGRDRYHIVNDDIKELGIVDDIQLKKVTEITPDHFIYQLIAIKDGKEFDISNLSSGGKQLLPILLFIENAEAWSDDRYIIIIQQPELHLHPKLQMKIVDFFDISAGTELFLVETHSEYIIRKLQLRIAKGDLSEKDVAIIYVNPVNSYRSEIIELPLNSRGMFTRPWPHGFFEESAVLNIQLIEEILKRQN